MTKILTGSGSTNENIEKSRAAECAQILNEIQKLILPFIEAADEDAKTKSSGQGLPRADVHGTTLVSSHAASELTKILNIQVPVTGQGIDGLLQAVQSTLQYSVNTWDPGFMDKLYASTDAPGLAAELVLATLNTNVHVYSVAPALTIIEKATTKALAAMFGLNQEHSGGISVQGGAASNLTSLLIARNSRYPEVKTKGMSAVSKTLAIFTSSEAHYSVSAAAASLGLGTEAVHLVKLDKHGAMNVHDLEEQISAAINTGKEPFYVSATAGTTVRGAYDPFTEIAEVCQRHGAFFHIDAAWGGPAIFSGLHKHKLAGSHRADTIAINPHKMMGVPLTCSFLLGKDLRTFYAANSLAAGYLFHDDPEDSAIAPEARSEIPAAADVYDLASFTPQCGRRGDSVKLYLSWIYHGTSGYERQIDAAFAACQYMVDQISKLGDFHLFSDNPPPCCQCCFYYRPKRLEKLLHGDKLLQTKLTRRLVAGLVGKGWMVDYAPGELGEFVRVVTNRGTTNAIVDGLVKAINEVGTKIVEELI